MLMTIRKDHIINFVVNYEAVIQHYKGAPKETDAIAQEIVEFLTDAVPSPVFNRVAELMTAKDEELRELQRRYSKK